MTTKDDAAQLVTLAQKVAADATADAAAYAGAQATITAQAATIASRDARIAALEAQINPPAPVPTPTPAPGPTSPLSSYPKLAWRDEFDAATVDTSKWRVDDGVAAHNERAYRLARNVTVSGGSLVVQPKLESAGGRLYTSGSVNCLYVAQRPFYAETRASMPLATGKCAGMWPAPIWFRGVNAAGEIDGCEFFELGPDASAAAIAEQPHGKMTSHIYADTNTGAGKAGILLPTPIDATAWHTYGVQVAADGSVTTYLDGKVVKNFPVATYPYLATAFAGGYRFISTLQIGSNYYGGPDGNVDWSQSMRHDYVRFWTP